MTLVVDGSRSYEVMDVMICFMRLSTIIGELEDRTTLCTAWDTGNGKWMVQLAEAWGISVLVSNSCCPKGKAAQILDSTDSVLLFVYHNFREWISGGQASKLCKPYSWGFTDRLNNYSAAARPESASNNGSNFDTVRHDSSHVVVYHGDTELRVLQNLFPGF